MKFYYFQILVNGIVISESRTEYRGNRRFYADIKRHFYHLLKSALLNPDGFLFEGFGGKMNAAEFLEHHRKQLNNPLEGRFELILDNKLEDWFNTQQ